MSTIYTALHKAKQQLGKVPKNATNPFFKSKYFDINGLLEVVEPILHDNGLFVLQPIVDGNVTTVIVHAESGERVESSMKLSSLTDPQKQGSEVTYYRRYTLQSLLAMQADDDDGNAASKAATAPPKQLPTLTDKSPNFDRIAPAIAAGKATWEDLQKKYVVTTAMANRLELEILNIKEGKNA